MIPTCHQFKLHPLVRPFKKLTNHTNFLPFSWLKKFNKRVTVGLPFLFVDGDTYKNKIK